MAEMVMAMETAATEGMEEVDSEMAVMADEVVMVQRAEVEATAVGLGLELVEMVAMPENHGATVKQVRILETVTTNFHILVSVCKFEFCAFVLLIRLFNLISS